MKKERKLNKSGKERKKKSRIYNSYEDCKNLILKYTSRTRFIKEHASVHRYIKLNKWENLLTTYLPRKTKKWSYEKCNELVSKYKYLKDFRENERQAYSAILKNKWNKLLKKLKITGNKMKRLIYAAEFTDNHVYIGLTGNPRKRFNEHLTHKRETVYQHMELSGLIPEFKLLTDYMNKDLSSIQEGEYRDKYKSENWIILNRARTGSLGGSTKDYSFKFCLSESMKYKTKKEFIKNSSTIYEFSKRKKWLNKIYKKRGWREIKEKINWTIEMCKQEALKFNTPKEFYETSNYCYKTAAINGWLAEITKHMTKFKHNYWTLEKCIDEVKKHTTKKDFYTNSTSAYAVSLKNNWISEVYKYLNFNNLNKEKLVA
jgi:hypothetical protein